MSVGTIGPSAGGSGSIYGFLGPNGAGRSTMTAALLARRGRLE
jgi:ABC-type Mn2+/Zn2+ transport system ATPase subunit